MLFYVGKEVCSVGGFAVDTETVFPITVEFNPMTALTVFEQKAPIIHYGAEHYADINGIDGVVHDTLEEALQATLDKHVKYLNDCEIAKVNEHLKSRRFSEARFRQVYRGHVVQSMENENAYTLSVSKRTVDNDLSADCFVCSLLKSDVDKVITALEACVNEKLSGKKFEAILKACYNDLGLANTINRTRVVYLKGLFITQHDVKEDIFKRVLVKRNRAVLFSAILASDEIIAKKAGEKAKSEKAKSEKKA